MAKDENYKEKHEEYLQELHEFRREQEEKNAGEDTDVKPFSLVPPSPKMLRGAEDRARPEVFTYERSEVGANYATARRDVPGVMPQQVKPILFLSFFFFLCV